MSRYVQVELGAVHADLDLLCRALDALSIPYQAASPCSQLMLEGSLECTGEPVDIRFASGQLDTVEDFGLVRANGEVRLVCGELDRELLLRELVSPLRQCLAALLVTTRAEQAGIAVEHTVTNDGTQRIRLRST